MGFPTRISRAALGPKRRDRGGVAGPDDISVNAWVFELEHWQLAGVNQTSAMVSALFTAGATPTFGSSSEAWDPNAESDAPTLSRVGAGHFRLTFPTTAADENGTEVAIVLDRARAEPQTGSDYRCTATASGNVVDVYLRNSAGTLVDDAILIWVDAA